MVRGLAKQILKTSPSIPDRVKWKKRSPDASLVAPSAHILSTMLRKSLMWSFVKRLEKPPNGDAYHDGSLG
ncbi:hypothetical protein Tco_0740898 [Tanacetum coccineum]